VAAIIAGYLTRQQVFDRAMYWQKRQVSQRIALKLTIVIFAASKKLR